MSRILVADNDAEIVGQVVATLLGHEYQSFSVPPTDDVFKAAIDTNPALILLGQMSAGCSQSATLRRLKSDPRTSDIPVIVTGAGGDDATELECLQHGADDYLKKPFSADELLARLSAVLRRAQGLARMRSGAFVLDQLKSLIHYRGTTVRLTPTEFRLFVALLAGGSAPRKRRDLLEEVWGYHQDHHSRTLDTHVKRLRVKLGPVGKFIVNVKGLGYQFLCDAASEWVMSPEHHGATQRRQPAANDRLLLTAATGK
jgi:two-component system phosphate regulon response regulator PhoB